MRYVLYDGDCPFCSHLSNKISSLIVESDISFLPFNSARAIELISNYGIKDIESVIYIDDSDRIFLKANACLILCKFMRFPYNLLYSFRFLPNYLLDLAYNFIARNRHRI